MNQQTTEMSFQLLIEEDKIQGDFIGYIPALRLGVQGDSLEEVRVNAADLLQMEIESRLQMGKSLPSDNTATMERLTISVPLPVEK
ncbi:type II toxin-antitoxin system HicB family antitoxin (plasmid) [Paenibacillus rhizovicinus]|uniref:Type II toxin-antitoxin system HicB family antitoxin n=1 Tax=Paenibacillus rhizovicinus TaxID=2704463 RepID=A0A6C0PAG7_9BACL|nr:type II toxin-antitoxin system HicB family antitoxin [Paenibacillus rhizovicinus]QHW35580.1 type II toxin-antitoxin system HicB family antitoxin [Paenibacillus rhizovicinus]